MFITICLLAISLSIDALGIGITYGVRNIKVPFLAKLIICIFTVITTSASLFLGKLTASLISPRFAELFGCMLLVCMGLWIILQCRNKKMDEQIIVPKQDKTLLDLFIKSMGISIKIMRHRQDGDMDHSNVIEAKEALYLGLALSIDSIGAGFGSAVAGLDSMWIPVIAALFQIIFLGSGVYTGRKIQKAIRIDNRIWTLMSGVTLISLGIIRFMN